MLTAGKWRAQFAKERLHGVSDAPLPGQPRRITDTKVEAVVTRTLEGTPANAIHWNAARKTGSAILSCADRP